MKMPNSAEFDPNSHLHKLFIGGLHFETRDKSLRAFYSQFGEVLDAVVPIDRETNRSRCFGFITYANADSVDKAMMNRPHVIDGRQVDPKRAIPKEMLMEASVVGMPQANGAPKVKAAFAPLRIFVGGVRRAHTEDQLKKYFSSFGAVTKVDIMKDRETGMSRGFAFVEFDDYDAVDKCILQKFHVIEGHKCEARKADLTRIPKLNRKIAEDRSLGFSPDGSFGFSPLNMYGAPLMMTPQQPGLGGYAPAHRPIFAPTTPRGGGVAGRGGGRSPRGGAVAGGGGRGGNLSAGVGGGGVYGGAQTAGTDWNKGGAYADVSPYAHFAANYSQGYFSPIQAQPTAFLQHLPATLGFSPNAYAGQFLQQAQAQQPGASPGTTMGHWVTAAPAVPGQQAFHPHGGQPQQPQQQHHQQANGAAGLSLEQQLNAAAAQVSALQLAGAGGGGGGASTLWTPPQQQAAIGSGIDHWQVSVPPQAGAGIVASGWGVAPPPQANHQWNSSAVNSPPQKHQQAPKQQQQQRQPAGGGKAISPYGPKSPQATSGQRATGGGAGGRGGHQAISPRGGGHFGGQSNGFHKR